MATRAGDKGRIAAWWGRYGRDLVTVVAVGLAAWAVFGSTRAANDAKHTAAQIKAESANRIDETCRISETKQRADSDALQRTYEYLGGLSAHQLAQPLNRAVLAGLPTTIRNAQVDDAPSYCDKPGVGLPEPDPPVPCKSPGVPKHCLEAPANLPPSS